MGLTEDAQANIAELREEFQRLRGGRHDDLSGGDDQEVLSLLFRVRAAIDRHVPANSSYEKDAASIREYGGWEGFQIKQYMSLLEALSADAERGYIRKVEASVREAVYDDFLDMALAINEIHPAPAAVVAGSVLEEHVRKLATANGIEAYDEDGKGRKFESLTQELRKTDPPVISEPQRKVLAGWYGQRTEAAHARWENVIAEDVPRIIEGVRDFLSRHPA